MATANIRYSDFRQNFNIHPAKKDLALITDAVSITSALKNLVLTGRYERFWDPLKGAGIPQTLFENMTSDTEFLLETRVREVIAKYEPRATRVNVQVAAAIDNNGYVCTIYYTPINTTQQETVQVIFERVR